MRLANAKRPGNLPLGKAALEIGVSDVLYFVISQNRSRVALSSGLPPVPRPIGHVLEASAPPQVPEGVVRGIVISMKSLLALRARPNELLENKAVHVALIPVQLHVEMSSSHRGRLEDSRLFPPSLLVGARLPPRSDSSKVTDLVARVIRDLGPLLHQDFTAALAGSCPVKSGLGFFRSVSRTCRSPRCVTVPGVFVIL